VPDRKSSGWTWPISILALIVFLDLIALTWYFWAMPVDLFNEKKKILTTVASWAGSILTFLGIRYKFKKGQSIEQVLAIRPVQLCVIAFTAIVCAFIVPIHNLSLLVTEPDLNTPVSGVTVKMDKEEFERTGSSNPRGKIKIAGISAAPHKLCFERKGYTTKCVNTGFMEAIIPWHESPVTMAKAEGKIQIRTIPDGAEIYLDGDDKTSRGETNTTLTLTTGTYRVMLKKAGYDPIPWEEIRVTETDNASLKKTLKAIPLPPLPEYPLQVLSYPADAEIWVDGALRARTKATLRLTKGQHKIIVRKDDYRPQEYNVAIPHEEPINCILQR